jgi:hypothetical protein
MRRDLARASGRASGPLSRRNTIRFRDRVVPRDTSGTRAEAPPEPLTWQAVFQPLSSPIPAPQNVAFSAACLAITEPGNSFSSTSGKQPRVTYEARAVSPDDENRFRRFSDPRRRPAPACRLRPRMGSAYAAGHNFDRGPPSPRRRVRILAISAPQARERARGDRASNWRTWVLPCHEVRRGGCVARHFRGWLQHRPSV